MKQYKGYLIDLDGTMYRGSEKIEAASDFVKALVKKDIPYLFVTNNSSRTPEQVAEKLLEFDIPTTKEHIFTTSQATANFINEQEKAASVYVIGEQGLKEAISEKGFIITDQRPQYVVIGLDRELTYEKLATACLAVRDGARFISTNADIAIPTERGLVPGNGSLTSVITVSTGVQPIFIGKPEQIIMEQALKVLGTPLADTLMVGDNYDTDIMAGMNTGLDTLLVHTGVTTEVMLETIERKPTYSVKSLTEWLAYI
ncbi:TIGR01457 family HAD-type hydrolase [Bacillus sp. PS06]|uniref:TIGR01457 family HAD-type hydrolase n=1 Tax=Bacillus sp. PS06 TaxID=2764176 RepID=UPI00177C9B2F|nr:TIGR01457 family HAD-type hydrolase [Bacillus sp. PS06]MBD8070455.1 TIGR01457 family HAD-type hydrolase [Bacillus sp. PS06]